MARRVLPIIGLWIVGWGIRETHAQAPPSTAVEREDGQAQQLQTCRDGILDPQARPDERRRWADLLLSFDTLASKALVLELLSAPPRVEVQLPLCDALADRVRSSPRSLETSWAEPLLQLLGVESDELRSAAGRALSEFSTGSVVHDLGAIASRPDAPMTKRLAAIDALAPSTHRREVIGQLIALLELEVPEISERVATALDPIAPRSLGCDSKPWRVWWDEQMQLSDEAWLAEQLRLYRDRSRGLAAEVQTLRADAERTQTAVVVHLRDYQRELLRTLTPEQRETRLVEWMGDPLPVVKLAGLGIVKARIADEGKRPEGEVLAGLLRLLKHHSPVLRREALQIVQNLGEAAVVEAVLARLGEEKELTLRHAVFQALGKLGSVSAVPALLREIASASSTPDCVREASLALSLLSANPDAKEYLQNAAPPLLDRYRAAPTDESGLRAALLSAMAGVADPSFAAEFVQAVESEDKGVLQAGLRGLRAVGDATKLPRCRALVAHADPRVRLAAIEAVASVGREEADAEALLGRLNPSVETNELARDAAWRGLRQFLSKRPAGERVRAVDRLRDTPDLAVKYMEELAVFLASTPDHVTELEALRDRLSTTLVTAGRDAEAVVHLRELHAVRSGRGDPTSAAVGLRWLGAALRSPSPTGLAEIIVRLAESSVDSATREAIVRTVQQAVESPAIAADADRTRRLFYELRAVPTGLLGEEWTQLLKRLGVQFEALEKELAPKPPA